MWNWISDKKHAAVLLAAAALIAALPFVPAEAAKKSLVKGPYIVVDAANGAVIAHRDAQRPWFPASTTKLMTAYVTFKAMKAGKVQPKSPVVISKNALSEPPSKMGFPVGTVLTIDNALKIIMVKSANDVSVALAEAVGGTEEGFIAMMNAEARRLGMTQTSFANPHGLPNKAQVTSARDLAILSRAALLEFPEYRSYLQIPSIRVGKRVLRNYNPLIDRYNGATGIKTGFICSSGYNLAASAKRGGREIIAIVLGAYSSVGRAETAAKLLNKGFKSRKIQELPNLTLANVSSGTEYGEAYDMRPYVCGKLRPAEARARFRTDKKGNLLVAQGKKTRRSLLGKRKSSKPIRVALGGTVGETAGLTKVFVGRLPKARPLDHPAVLAAEAVDTGTPTLATTFVTATGPDGPDTNAVSPGGIRKIAGIPVPLPRPSERSTPEVAGSTGAEDPLIATAFATTDGSTATDAAGAIDKAIRKISGIPVPVPRPNVQEGDNDGGDPASQKVEAGNT